MGRTQAERGEHAEAIVSLTKANALARKAKDPALTAKIQQAAGNAYSKSFLYEDALACYRNARVEYERAHDTAGIYSTLYAAARTLNNLEQYDKADSLFRFLVRNRTMDPSLEARIMADYALMKVTHEHDYLIGQMLYNYAVDLRPAFYNDNHWGAYAFTLEHAGRSGKADQLFAQLEKMGRDTLYSSLVWEGKTLAHRGEYQRASQLYEQALEQQSTNVRRVLRQSALRSQRDYYAHELQQSRRENRMIRTIIVLIFLLLMALVYAGFAVLRRRQEQALAEEEALIETARALSAQVDSLQEDRTHLQEERSRLQIQYARLQQRHFKEMGSLLKTTLGENPSNVVAKQATLYAKAKQAMKAIQSDPDGDQAFEAQLNGCFDHVMDHLRTELPRHTEEYYRFAAFVFAGFDNETLMALTGTRSLDSVYARKKRLRQDIAASEAPHKAQFQQLL